jgi:hypothetical protein
MKANKNKERKWLLALSRAGRPRWGSACQQRVVVPTKVKPLRKQSTRALLDREG